MDEEYPEHGNGGQDLDPERAGWVAPAHAEAPRQAAEPPPTGDDRVDGDARSPG